MKISLQQLSKLKQDSIVHVQMIPFNANLIDVKQMLRYWLVFKQ